MKEMVDSVSMGLMLHNKKPTLPEVGDIYCDKQGKYFAYNGQVWVEMKGLEIEIREPCNAERFILGLTEEFTEDYENY